MRRRTEKEAADQLFWFSCVMVGATSVAGLLLGAFGIEGGDLLAIAALCWGAAAVSYYVIGFDGFGTRPKGNDK